VLGTRTDTPVHHQRVTIRRKIQAIRNGVVIGVRVVRIGAGICGTEINAGIGLGNVLQAVAVGVDGKSSYRQ
jgi:hypothetical protein